MSDPRVVITGATGFLGWHIAEAFRNAGWMVTGVVRPGRAKLLPTGVEAVEATLESQALAKAIDGAAVLVHAAGLTRGRTDADFEAVNVAGTEAAVEAANIAGTRLVLVSSQAVIGTGTAARPSREDDPPRPVNAYGRSKLAAETLVRSRAQTPWTIVRPCAVYGPRDRQFLPLFRLAAHGWFPLVSDASTAFTLAYAEDVARSVVLATKGAGGSVWFIGHSQPQTSEGVLRALADVFQKPYKPWRVPPGLLSGMAMAGNLAWRLGITAPMHRERLSELNAEGFVCAIDRARDQIGFSAAVGVRDGFERTARWYRQQGWV